jgi:hypothetical protein
VEDELECAGERALDGRSAEFRVALRRVRIADGEQGARHRDRVVHRRTLADPPVVDVAAEIAGGIESTMSASAGASPITPKWGRTGMRARFRMTNFFSTVPWSTGTPG